MRAISGIIEATYLGIHPADTTSLGNNKYIGYDHLFVDIDGTSFNYANSRAACIPPDLVVGKRYKFHCCFKSSILANLIVIKEAKTSRTAFRNIAASQLALCKQYSVQKAVG
jgi:hypothetical protein